MLAPTSDMIRSLRACLCLDTTYRQCAQARAWAGLVVTPTPQVILFDEKCKPIYDLGAGPYNTVRWNPFGQFLLVAGFGNLPGELRPCLPAQAGVLLLHHAKLPPCFEHCVLGM